MTPSYWPRPRNSTRKMSKSVNASKKSRKKLRKLPYFALKRRRDVVNLSIKRSLRLRQLHRLLQLLNLSASKRKRSVNASRKRRKKPRRRKRRKRMRKRDWQLRRSSRRRHQHLLSRARPRRIKEISLCLIQC